VCWRTTIRRQLVSMPAGRRCVTGGQLGHRIGVDDGGDERAILVNKREGDLLDTFCYGIAIVREYFRRSYAVTLRSRQRPRSAISTSPRPWFDCRNEFDKVRDGIRVWSKPEARSGARSYGIESDAIICSLPRWVAPIARFVLYSTASTGVPGSLRGGTR